MSDANFIDESRGEVPDARLVKSHHNYFEFKTKYITKITYLENSLHIASGQPFHLPPTFEQKPDGWKLDIYCGRHRTKAVAESFVNDLHGGRFGPITKSGWPAEMNFYFGVKVEFVIEGTSFTSDIYLGQGSNAVNNNWWLRSVDIMSGDGFTLRDKSGNIQRALTVGGNAISDYVALELKATQDNTFTLAGAAIKKVAYVPHSVDIWDGESVKAPPAIQGSGDTWSFNLPAGRHKTKAVASRFVEASGGAAHLFGLSSDSASPAELNFAFAVDVTFEVSGQPYERRIHFGQGSNSASRNNWWMGAAAIARQDKHHIVEIRDTAGRVVATYRLYGDGVNAFRLV